MTSFSHITLLELFIFQVFLTTQGHNLEEPYRHYAGCDMGPCYPATGNLLIGRENNLTASSTCGTFGVEGYCIVSHLQEIKKCFSCDSRKGTENMPLLNHRIQNIIYSNHHGTKEPSWWQSENGKEKVTIQLDLGAEFHFTHLIMKFKTFRPAAMLIERSSDFGKTWKVYRYFAENCAEAFPNKTDADCDTKYSSVAPSHDGEVILRVITPTRVPNGSDPYSKELQNLLKMTNLRLNFTKLHTLGDDLLDKREEIQEKYYYAIKEMTVRGSCWCYGHAQRCLPVDGVPHRPDMVHGRCDCTHNTKGLNCQFCEDFYNDLPWSPATGRDTNACKKCNCNNHAHKCEFSEAVYNQTGRVSGGVCIDCQHNTIGNNCEQCKPYYYLDPSKDITHQDACLSCKCHTSGSLYDGLCDAKTDVALGLVAGRCHCKANVEGPFCNVCKPGYWNFDFGNPDGCEECMCLKAGTIPGSTCDVETGECKCKSNVTGKHCNQCIPEHWGLSENSDGCQPCGCDFGGSHDSNCDVVTGECKCRPNLVGRTCNTPEQAYFVHDLDMVYEAEYANCSRNCKVSLEVIQKNRLPSWTGPGYMRISDNTDLSFTIDNIKKSMEYDLVIRYEPQEIDDFMDVVVTLEREQPVDKNGPCANILPLDDIKNVSLHSKSWHNATTPLCLEADQNYKVKLSFISRDNNQVEAPSASILIDSIALIPRVESLDLFSGSLLGEERRREYERHRCNETYFTPLRGHISDICKQYHYSISALVFGGGIECNCHTTGSISSFCSLIGGACECKNNVVGRTCDSCAPGTYGFGVSGCTDCDCNSIGALNKFCDEYTGLCVCKNGTYGRACNLCKPGSWKYPDCLPCNCNGHAPTCDTTSGKCIACMDFTTGDHCEMCKEGYYGDPRLGYDAPCKPCKCPDTAESGHSFASSCNLIENTKEVVCECEAGYAGPRCDVCADNYYGNPAEPGGTCRPCNCNNNIDISKPGNCDLRTGECLQCLFNTTGPNCESCKPGFYGDALSQNCVECGCSTLGTDVLKGPCDPITGQCPCLLNVHGLKCDSCELNYWRIALGKGCEPCNCDPVGSESAQCHLYLGNCTCKPSFGGLQCNQCEDNFYGDPKVQCYPCECNLEGSSKLQCHQENGTCTCKTGIGGEKCDKCARGYIRKSSPGCESCGECFVNWDNDISILKDKTDNIIQNAREINKTGATGAYNTEFEEMNRKLEAVKKTLSDTKNNTGELGKLSNEVKVFNNGLEQSLEKLNILKSGSTSVNIQISDGIWTLNYLNNDQIKLKQSAEDLQNDATRIQENDLKGALNLTREAGKKSNEVKLIDQKTRKILDDVDRNCKRTDKFLRGIEHAVDMKNEKLRDQLDLDFSHFKNEIIPIINKNICGGEGGHCDNLCGGGGCGKCGGISCDTGAVYKADNGLKLANETEANIENSLETLKKYKRVIGEAKETTKKANESVQKVNNKSQFLKTQIENLVKQASNMTNKLQKFINDSGATPNDIRNLANSVLQNHISQKPEKIKKLTQQIHEEILSMTNVTLILEETKEDRKIASKLKQKADDAKADAEGVKNKTIKVNDLLDTAKDAQKKAEKAVTKANEDINKARRNLAQIKSDTGIAEMKAKDTMKTVKELVADLSPLQSAAYNYVRLAKQVSTEMDRVDREVVTARDNATRLTEKYKEMNNVLNNRSTNSSDLKKKAKSLLERAEKVHHDTILKYKNLEVAERDYDNQKNMLSQLQNNIEELTNNINNYTNVIIKKADFYQNCNT